MQITNITGRQQPINHIRQSKVQRNKAQHSQARTMLSRVTTTHIVPLEERVQAINNFLELGVRALSDLETLYKPKGTISKEIYSPISDRQDALQSWIVGGEFLTGAFSREKLNPEDLQPYLQKLFDIKDILKTQLIEEYANAVRLANPHRQEKRDNKNEDHLKVLEKSFDKLEKLIGKTLLGLLQDANKTYNKKAQDTLTKKKDIVSSKRFVNKALGIVSDVNDELKVMAKELREFIGGKDSWWNARESATHALTHRRIKLPDDKSEWLRFKNGKIEAEGNDRSFGSGVNEPSPLEQIRSKYDIS